MPSVLHRSLAKEKLSMFVIIIVGKNFFCSFYILIHKGEHAAMKKTVSSMLGTMQLPLWYEKMKKSATKL